MPRPLRAMSVRRHPRSLQYTRRHADGSSVGLIGALLFTIPACVFVARAAGPSSRRKLRWGEHGGGPRLSRLSYLSWAALFFVLAIALGFELRTGLIEVAFFVSVGLIFLSGARDQLRSSRHTKRRKDAS